MEKEIQTRCIHLENDDRSNVYGAISYPIFQTATFAHPGVGMSTGYDYSRAGNPTREQLEKTVASLESGRRAFAFSSGMAAITAVMELFEPGDHIITDSDLYGGSIRLFNTLCAKNQIEFTSADLSGDNWEHIAQDGKIRLEELIQPNTRAVFIETPTNPMMNVIDIQRLGEYTAKHGLLLIVDNTFLSPYFQNPLKLGADIVIHSGTKFISGHNDVLAGLVVADREDICDKIGFNLLSTGACLSPFDSWLVLRGIKTLAVRMEKAQENAGELADWLEQSGYAKKVIYPGKKEHPGYDIMKKQASGFGAMITFEVESREIAREVLKQVKLIRFAESLGGVETLITYPVTQTHADVPKDVLKKNGVTDRTLRLAVGIESAKNLIEDLGRALKEAGQSG